MANGLGLLIVFAALNGQRGGIDGWIALGQFIFITPLFGFLFLVRLSVFIVRVAHYRETAKHRVIALLGVFALFFIWLAFATATEWHWAFRLEFYLHRNELDRIAAEVRAHPELGANSREVGSIAFVRIVPDPSGESLILKEAAGDFDAWLRRGPPTSYAMKILRLTNDWSIEMGSAPPSASSPSP